MDLWSRGSQGPIGELLPSLPIPINSCRADKLSPGVRSQQPRSNSSACAPHLVMLLPPRRSVA